MDYFVEGGKAAPYQGNLIRSLSATFITATKLQQLAMRLCLHKAEHLQPLACMSEREHTACTQTLVVATIREHIPLSPLWLIYSCFGMCTVFVTSSHQHVKCMSSLAEEYCMS
jgi:hypothetical protein